MSKVRTVAKMCIPASAVLLVALMLALHSPSPREMAVVVYADLPSEPDEIAILETVTDEVTQRQALDVANEVFNVSGESEELDNAWKVWSGTRSLGVRVGGHQMLRYLRGLLGYAPSGRTPIGI